MTNRRPAPLPAATPRAMSALDWGELSLLSQLDPDLLAIINAWPTLCGAGSAIR